MKDETSRRERSNSHCLIRRQRVGLTLLAAALASVVSVSNAQAQNDEGLPPPSGADLARQRCEAKFPEKAREIRETEHQISVARENIRKDQTEAETKQRQADRNRQEAQKYERDAKAARDAKDFVRANHLTADAVRVRTDASDLTAQAAAYRLRVESLNRSVQSLQSRLNRLLQSLFAACNLPPPQVGGGNQGGGKQGNNNQGGISPDDVKKAGTKGAGPGGNSSSGVNAPAGVGNTGNVKSGSSSSPNSPIRVNLPNGGYKLLSRDQNGRVFRVEEFDPKGVSRGVDIVDRFALNGRIAESSSTQYGYPGKDKHKEIRRTEKYDENGFLAETSEHATYWDKSRHVKTTSYKDFGGKYGYNTRVVTEDGQTKTYVRDENGNWVLKEDLKTGSQNAGTVPPKPPVTPVNPPKANKPQGKFDTCLIGRWEAVSFTDLSGYGQGGTGFQVTFDRNGVQTADYSKMSVIVLPLESFYFKGSSVSKVETADNVATITMVIRPAPDGQFKFTKEAELKPFPVNGAGPGALGSARDGTYVCTETSLEFKSSVASSKRPSYQVKLNRVKN